jgi:hypothetical protein
MSVLTSRGRNSICSEISGTINRSDFARFDDVYANPAVRSTIEKSASICGLLADLTSQKPVDVRAAAEKLAAAPQYNVIQVRPKGYGYVVKTSAAPKGMNPQEVEMTAQQAQQALPPEMLQAADEQGAATVTQVEAQPDPLQEQAAPASGFGTYKVMDAASNKELVGFVIPNLLDPMTGQSAGMSLFTNGSQYALQPEILGVLTGISFNLPASRQIRGLGVFYRTDGKTLQATIPFEVISEITVEGRTFYAARTAMNQEVQIVMSEGLRQPMMINPGEIAIPADFSFLGLDNPVQLAGSDNLMKAASAHAYPTMVEVRAWDGGCVLSGPVFEKVGSGQHSWADGLFYLAAAGCPQNLGTALLEKAASTGKPVRLFGFQALSDNSGLQKEAQLRAKLDLSNVHLPPRVNLLKEAAALSKEASALTDLATLDAILALNFINPENVETFVENIPSLEQASTKLAEIVLASQLGLQSIPKTAAVKAMFAMENVIQGLKGLQRHQI